MWYQSLKTLLQVMDSCTMFRSFESFGDTQYYDPSGVMFIK